VRLLLDTNVVSEVRRPKPQPGSCAPSFAQVQQGAEWTRRQGLPKAVEIDVWLDEVRDSVPVVPIGVDACPPLGSVDGR